MSGIPWAVRLERAILAGVCVRCGDPAPAGTCDGCTDAAMVKQDERRAELIAQGRCRCGRPAKPGSRQCTACLAWDRGRERWRERLPAARETEQGLMDNKTKERR